jgi:glycosyltransferase involved in cell wall biosynthesis
MIRVCYVIPTLSVGGTERQLAELIQGLAPDHDIIVACTHHDGALAGDVRRAGADVHVLGAGTAWTPALYWKTREIFQRHRPDIVHSFMFGFDFLVNAAARNMETPVVVSSRRELATWMKRRHRFMQNLANRYVDCVVANSKAASDYAIATETLNADKIRVIPNGIDPDEFLSHCDHRHLLLRYRIPFYRRIIGIVANFSPVKDHALFVQIAESLMRRRADLHFVMVGNGPLAGEIDAMIASRKLESCFTRVTTLQEIGDLYALMDVSVLCSKSEGFPNAIMESMAAGKPVVASAVGGIMELVRDGDTGRLVASRNPEDFADVIEWALDNSAESSAMAERAAVFIRKEYSIGKMVESYRGLYANLLRSALRKGR